MRDLVDPDVREAISLAIDRDALVALYGGGASPIDHLSPEGHPGHTDAIGEFTKADPARAAELIKEAPKGTTSITMAHVDDGMSLRLAQLVQTQLKAVRIELTLKPITHASIYDPRLHEPPVEVRRGWGLSTIGHLLDSSPPV